MGCIGAVFYKDFKTYFSSFIAYATIAVFLIITGYFFFNMVGAYAQMCVQAQQTVYAQNMNMTKMILSTIFMNVSTVMLFMLPMLSMRSFAEEKKTGTTELLFTYPVTDLQIVLGKFFALASVFAIMILPLFCYPAIVSMVGGVISMKTFLAGMLGLFLMGLSFLSLGMFISSMTENQIVAISVSFAALLLCWTIVWVGNILPEGGRYFCEHISLLTHFHNSAQGVIDSQDILYYVLFIVFFLYFTLRLLESRNWRG